MGTSISIISPGDPLLMSVLDRKLSVGCELFLNDSVAREAFACYVKTGAWKDEIPLCSTFFEGDVATLSLLSEHVYTDFIYSSTPSELASQMMKKSSDGESGPARPAQSQSLDQIKNKIRDILLAAIFPIFLRSNQYLELIEMKSRSGSFVIQLPPERCRDFTTREDRLDSLFQECEMMDTREVIMQAAASVDENEIDTLLSSGKWLRNLLASVENLNFCVTLATARPDRRGFPLIYVNKAFERLSGYAREEIVGQNCKFLQSEWTEEDQIKIIVESLATAQPCKVAITNKRKDGTGIFLIFS